MTTKLVNLKLKETVPANIALSRLAQIYGVIKIESLFPKATDPKLAILYVATIKLRKSNSILKQLSSDHDVEFAEIQPRRKLIK